MQLLPEPRPRLSARRSRPQATAFLTAGPGASFMTALMQVQAGVCVRVREDGVAERDMLIVTHQLPCSKQTVSKHYHERVGLWALTWGLEAPLIADSDDD